MNTTLVTRARLQNLAVDSDSKPVWVYFLNYGAPRNRKHISKRLYVDTHLAAMQGFEAAIKHYERLSWQEVERSSKKQEEQSQSLMTSILRESTNEK